MDWVWPFSLAYPQEQIAIINDICVIHPKKELQPGTKLTIYQAHNPHGELVAVLAKYGYEAEVRSSPVFSPREADVAIQKQCITAAMPEGILNLLFLTALKDTLLSKQAKQQLSPLKQVVSWYTLVEVEAGHVSQ